MENSIEKTLEPLVYGWIDAGQAVWSGREPFSLRAGSKSAQIVDPLPWTELVKKVAELVPVAKKGGIKGAMLKQWLSRLTYFLGPAVSGVGPHVAKKFIRQKDLKDEWKQSTALIAAYHQEIINFLVEKKMNTLVEQLGRAVNEHLELFPKGNPRSTPSSRRTSGKGGVRGQFHTNKPPKQGGGG